MAETTKTRPTKKQKQLLDFIQSFIAEHGYSPSYREIMQGCSYNSVATVSLHVNSLIKRGHIQKRDNEARSLEVVGTSVDQKQPTIPSKNNNWLINEVNARFKKCEQNTKTTKEEIDQLFVLVGAVKILVNDEAWRSFIPRLQKVRVRE